MRCAIYFIPPREHQLCTAAAAWLRRDPYTGASVAAPIAGLEEEDHARLTAPPRRYGFHATIKAPFRLAGGQTVEQLATKLGSFASSLVPFEISLEIARLGAFFAYVPQAEIPDLTDLAARVVAEFDHFRAPLSEADIARRNVATLTERQLSHLTSWGYPYVFDEFRFHMTLTGPVDAADRPAVEAALASHFGSAPQHVPFGQLVIAVEPVERGPFILHSIHPLAQMGARLRA